MFATILLTFSCLLLAGFISRHLRLSWLSRSNGCSPPASVSRPFWDILGFTTFMASSKISKNNAFFPAMQERFEKHGRTWTTRSLGRDTVFTIEPKNLQNILSLNTNNWGVHERLEGFRSYNGHGFLTTDGTEYEGWKDFVRPSFDRSNIWDHRPFARLFDGVLQKMPTDEATFDLLELIKMLYLDTTTLFLFGEPFGALTKQRAEESEKFMTSHEYALRAGIFRLLIGPLRHVYRDKKEEQCITNVHRFVDGYVERAISRWQREKTEGGDTRSLSEEGGKRHHMCDAMAQQTSDVVAIRNNVVQAFIASHDTTGFLIGNVVWLLARHPNVWAKLRADILEQIDVEPELTFDTPGRIQFLRDVIDETLRLYPVFARLGRRAYADCTLPAGGGPSGEDAIFCPAGTSVDCTILAVHRRKDIYGDDADEWKPERWAKLRDSLPPWTFIPFGAGQRACLGKPKALAETGFFICRMAQEFSMIKPRDDRPWVASMKATVSNLNGCLIACTPARKTG